MASIDEFGRLGSLVRPCNDGPTLIDLHQADTSAHHTDDRLM